MSELKPCLACKKPLDSNDEDTLYPSGVAWKFDDELQMRTYHSFREVGDKSQWCYNIVCGCGYEMHGDTKQDAIEKHNTRSAVDKEKLLLETNTAILGFGALAARNPSNEKIQSDCKAKMEVLSELVEAINSGQLDQ